MNCLSYEQRRQFEKRLGTSDVDVTGFTQQQACHFKQEFEKTGRKYRAKGNLMNEPIFCRYKVLTKMSAPYENYFIKMNNDKFS